MINRTLSKYAKLWNESREDTTGLIFLFFLHTYVVFKEMKEYEDNLPFCFSYAVVRISLYFWGFVVANLIDILLEN